MSKGLYEATDYVTSTYIKILTQMVAGDAYDWEADKLRRSAMQLTSNHIGECEDKEKIHDE